MMLNIDYNWFYYEEPGFKGIKALKSHVIRLNSFINQDIWLFDWINNA